MTLDIKKNTAEARVIGENISNKKIPHRYRVSMGIKASYTKPYCKLYYSTVPGIFQEGVENNACLQRHKQHMVC